MKGILFACLLAGVLSVEAVQVTAVPQTDSSKRVETYATQLKADLASQEKAIHLYLDKNAAQKTIQTKQLKSLTLILGHLSEQLKNTTKYYTQYNGLVATEQNRIKPFTIEYDRAYQLYNSTTAKIKEERDFLDLLISYVKKSADLRSKCK